MAEACRFSLRSFVAQGPELLEHCRASFDAEQRMVFGATTFRDFVGMLAAVSEEPEVLDLWVTRMRSMPATMVSSTLEEPLDWLGGATVASGDAIDFVARLEEESDVPLRSHGSLSLNRALMAAGLIDRVQLRMSPRSPGRPGRIRSSRTRPTSTSSCSRAGPATAIPRS